MLDELRKRFLPQAKPLQNLEIRVKLQKMELKDTRDFSEDPKHVSYAKNSKAEF